MSNAVQLSLFDLGPATVSPAARKADWLACIADKVQADEDMGLLGGEDFEADFPGDE